MAIIRIFIRSIILKKNLHDNASGRTFTFMPKGQVILRGKPNKAIQVNCSQGFPFHPFFPCRWSILNRYEHSRN